MELKHTRWQMTKKKGGGIQKNCLIPRDLFQLKINKEIILLLL